MMVDWSLAWPAPAKLNLMLRIVGQRSDGYHELQTVFQFIDYGDELGFRLRSDSKVERLTKVPAVAVEDDLIVKAAKLLQATQNEPLGIDIKIDKKLPMGGGLGGGSSDAATTLIALNKIWNCGFDLSDLAKMGLKLGADVPIFIYGHAAWAEGVGERFQAIAPVEPHYLIIFPPVQVDTGKIFCDPHLTRDSSRIKIRAFVEGDVRNDCLSVVCKNYPKVAQAIEWLDQFAQARLTGTGSSVFAAFESENAALEVQQQLPEEYSGVVAKGLNKSPLLTRLAECD